MDLLAGLRELSSQMDFEPAEDAGFKKTSCKQDSIHIFDAKLPNGKQIRLLKTLLTSACENNCNYCPFRAGRDVRRSTLKSGEMAQVFDSLLHAGIVEGMFLSSGVVGGGILTQDRLIDTAEILRFKFGFRGYLHLKIMPGAERGQVERSMQLADRVSLNLEAPNSQCLERLAPGKVFSEELIQPLRWVEEIRQTIPACFGWKNHWPSMTTQFVVGAVNESDVELLTTTDFMHRNLGLGRAYFSPFRPVLNTPFENQPPTSPIREHRLYQASFLLRDYDFELEELPFGENGNLPLSTDPKLAWATSNLIQAPIEINRSSRRELLRVPGIGPKSVDAILEARRKGRIRTLEDIRKIGIDPYRAAPFILLDGKIPNRQLSFW